jgi:exonuclease SbcD
MRLLHTSDWHLGRTLHGVSLLGAQREFLSWLVREAREREVDAVLVAGDVYDRAVPSTDAVALLDEALVALARAGVPVLLTSGNHDSAIRLGFAGALQEVAGVHVRTRLADLTRPLVLRDAAGELGVYGIPYLLPDAVLAELGAERSHASVLRRAVEAVLADARARGLDRTVVVGHAFVTGGIGSDSERDITVGGIGDAPADVFDGVTYAALGHLHGRQHITPRVGYSGSPLPFSFSERDHVKSVSVIDIGATVRVDVVPTPVPRRLVEVRGRLEELLSSRRPGLEQAWLKVVLTDPVRPHAPMERLRERWPHTLVLDFQPEGQVPVTDAPVDAAAPGKAPLEICTAFVEWVDSTLPTSRQRSALESAIDAVVRAELSA